MLVKINGKEVEVGPGRAHKQNCGCLGKLFQKTTQDSGDHSGLTINGNKVDMNNPDDVQRALRSCRTIGGMFFGVIAFILIAAAYGIDWANFDVTEDVIAFFIVASVWFVIAFVFAILVPRSLQKRLDELKKQGKIPSKYAKKIKQESAPYTQEKSGISYGNSNHPSCISASSDYPKLIVNGREVDLGDPRVIQKISIVSKKVGSFVMLIGLVFAIWDISFGLSLILMGLVCKTYFPKRVEKILQELEKQGKVPPKH